MMDIANGAVDNSMLELAKAFERHRLASAHRAFPYPKTLKAMAVHAVRAQNRVVDVAAACAVSARSVYDWMQESTPTARKLRVVADVVQDPQSTLPSADCLFVFRLPAGISIEASAEQTLWLIEKLRGQL